MKLKDMSDDELNDVLMTEFPLTLSLEESRERLEMMISECYDSLFGTWGEDKPEEVISPWSVWVAMMTKAEREVRRMTKDEFDAAVKSAEERHIAILAKRKSEIGG